MGYGSTEPTWRGWRVTGLTDNDTHWRTAAACGGHDAWALFDPAPSNERKPQRKARVDLAWDAFCGSCPVRIACADEAITHKHEGIWGGHLFRMIRGHGNSPSRHYIDTPAPDEFNQRG
jgi:hypothetical protein